MPKTSTQPLSESFGERILAIMERIRLRPADITRLTYNRVSRANISRHTTKRRHANSGALPQPKEETVFQIAKALRPYGVMPEELYDVTKFRVRPSLLKDRSPDTEDPNRVRLNAYYDELPESLKPLAVDLIEAVWQHLQQQQKGEKKKR